MKKQIITLFFSVLISVSAFSQVRIGYMSPAEVLASLEEVQEIENRIDSLITLRDQELITKSTQLQQDIATYEEGKAVLSADARTRAENDLLQRSEDLETERENALNEIRQRRVQMLSPILEKMDLAIQAVATRQGFDLVLNQGTSYGDAIIFYSQEESFNITQAVIDEIKSN